MPARASRGDIVQVKGRVRIFTIAEAEDEVGTTLDHAAFLEFEGEPVVIADEIDLQPRLEGAPGQVRDGDRAPTRVHALGKADTVDALSTARVSA